MSDDKTKGERIAKVMARAGIASRRDAEKMILAGRVAVNGKIAASPALDVTPSDKVTLDGKPIDAPQPARLWLYFKPVGLVTSAKDDKGRQTVFDTMPEGMPRVMSVGRLDLTSEGLLLLTNDGELKRKLELPTTGWLRKYRVRVNGRPNDATFDPLRRGVTIDGEDFQPMEITLDKQQGANAWLTVGIREGRNREIRRAMSEVGLTVNRLIRVSYGPFRLNQMKPGDVVEVKARVMREQLGGLAGEETRDEGARGTKRPAAPRKPRAPRGPDSPHRAGAPKPGGRGGKDFKPRTTEGEERPRRPRAAPGSDRGRPDKDFRPREGAPAWKKRDGENRTSSPRDRDDAKPQRARRDGPATDDRNGAPKRRPGGHDDARPARGKPREAGAKPDRRPRDDARGPAGGKPRTGKGGFSGEARGAGKAGGRSTGGDRPGRPRDGKGGPRKGPRTTK